MTRRKRGKDDEEESTPSKRNKPTVATRRSARKSVSEELPPTNEKEKRFATRRTTSRPTEDDIVEISSDSSSLSDPPSTINTPIPPKSSPENRATNTTKVERIPTKRSTHFKKVSSKEHEEALNWFVRDDSEDESSISSSEDVQESGSAIPDLSGDEEDDDWEDVDLSHKKEISLEDLDGSTETPDLEVTLERTQQSMRIKYSPPYARLIIRNKASSAAERKIRMHTHLLHVQCLLVHGAIRNTWLEDQALQVNPIKISLRLEYSTLPCPRLETSVEEIFRIPTKSRAIHRSPR